MGYVGLFSREHAYQVQPQGPSFLDFFFIVAAHPSLDAAAQAVQAGRSSRLAADEAHSLLLGRTETGKQASKQLRRKRNPQAKQEIDSIHSSYVHPAIYKVRSPYCQITSLGTGIRHMRFRSQAPILFSMSFKARVRAL